MEQVTAYRASDGRLFDNALDAKKHEATIGIHALPSPDSRGLDPMVVDWLLEHHARIGELLSAIGRTDNKPVFPAVATSRGVSGQTDPAVLMQNGGSK